MRERIVLILAVGGLAAGCGGSEESSSATQVVAAFYPLAFVAERIAPEADVVNITPAGAEPHDLELSARDVEAIGEADHVLFVGSGFQPALEEAVEGHDGAVDLLESVSVIDAADGPDPHVWLDPVRLAAMARAAAGELGDRTAADALVADLEQLDRDFQAGLAECARRELVTSHAAFGYLADAYDLTQVPLGGVSPEAEPSAGDLEALVAEVESSGATTVFFETLVSPKLAETVAREAGAETAVLNPLEGLTDEELAAGQDYMTVMRANLEALRRGLGCT